MQKKTKKKCILYLAILAAVILLNILAWNSAAFCDWYLTYIFPVWVNTYGRVTGLFPFSVGEWLIILGVLVVVLAVIFLVLWGSAILMERLRGKNYAALVKFSKGYLTFFVWALLGVFTIMTLNCLILYHASTFSETYFGAEKEEYSAEELLTVYNLVVRQCNQLSAVVDRDEKGMPIFDAAADQKGNRVGMNTVAKQAMQKLGEKYSRLSGWYPNPKAMTFSDFMCQQHMQGYYFPFSMEANYNDIMTNVRKPSTMCHELAHLRGYIYEDEANFIGYLACVQSEDAFFQYSGYLGVLGYLDQDVMKLLSMNPDAFLQAAEKVGIEEINNQVFIDDIFVTDEEWERINGKAIIDTETVSQAADTFVETNLKVNGVSDGKVSYSRVVRLLLQYYGQHN